MTTSLLSRIFDASNEHLVEHAVICPTCTQGLVRGELNDLCPDGDELLRLMAAAALRLLEEEAA